MRILITGSGGRLGRLLFAAKHRLDNPLVDLVFQSRFPGRDLQWQPTENTRLLPKCDALVALWGVTSGTDDELAVNTTLVELSQKVARDCGAKKVFHLSSAAVYGAGTNMSEDWPARPQSAYGVAKARMEGAVRAGRNDLVQSVLRLANVVGADSLAHALSGTGAVHLDRFGDGHGPIRSYIGATDLLQVLCGLAGLEPDDLPFAINVSAPAPVAMGDLAAAAGKTITWRTAPSEAVQTVSLDVTRLQALLPSIRPTTDAVDLVADLRRLEATL